MTNKKTKGLILSATIVILIIAAILFFFLSGKTNFLVPAYNSAVNSIEAKGLNAAFTQEDFDSVYEIADIENPQEFSSSFVAGLLEEDKKMQEIIFTYAFDEVSAFIEKNKIYIKITLTYEDFLADYYELKEHYPTIFEYKNIYMTMFCVPGKGT